MRRQVTPSGVSMTTPPAPTSQHTCAAGAVPARIGPVVPSGWACQVWPPSAVCSIAPLTIRHCELRSGETITVGAVAAFIATAAKARLLALSDRDAGAAAAASAVTGGTAR